MLNYAVLIDGGFAKRKLGPPGKPAEAQDFSRLIGMLQEAPELQNMHLHRVYYYDSSPLMTTHPRPLGGGQVAFGETPQVAQATALFAELKRMPYWALRLGELSFQGWKLDPHMLRDAPGPQLTIAVENLKPQITQKGVDMRIGMDIAALTLKRQAQVIVLVTGDSDMIPAMKFARREGAQVFLVPLRQNVKEGMHEHSDRVIDLSPRRPRAENASFSA